MRGIKSNISKKKNQGQIIPLIIFQDCVLYCTAQRMARYGHIHSYSLLCALKYKYFLSKYHIIQLLFQMECVMVHIFMLILVILEQTSLTKSRDLRYALIIQLEKYLCVDEVSKWDQSGGYRV